jgi:4-amino-4-deoxy-L-arabinose transferase-like glycosyltransferase
VRKRRGAAFAVAVCLSGAFILVSRRYLDVLVYDFDESWLMMDARFILRGLRPFADFAHHEMPLYPYLLALSGKVFGQTVVGFRMLSVTSIAVTGLLLFWITRDAVGSIAALGAQALFLFSPVHTRSLSAVPETTMVLFTLLAVVCLCVAKGRVWPYAGGVSLVLALLVKPTCLFVVVAILASVAYAREWSRLRAGVLAALVAGIAGAAWILHVSEGVVLDVVALQLERVGTRRFGMWSIESGFTDMLRVTGIRTPLQLAWTSLKTFYHYPGEYMPVALLVVSALGVPVWVRWCGRSHPALRALAVLWPASYLLVNFAALDFVTPRYFIPFPAFSSFLLAALVWLAQRWVPPVAVAGAGVLASVALTSHLATSLDRERDPWHYGRSNWIAEQYPSVVSFTPMFFVSTGAEPGCGLSNPALTYGGFGETLLGDRERTRHFRFDDDRLIECLRANPQIPVVVDWAFYFFTRPGSPLRRYLEGEGHAQRLFFSPDAVEQWNRPLLTMDPYR